MREVTEGQRQLIEMAILHKTKLSASTKREVLGGHLMSLEGEYAEIVAFLPNVLSRLRRFEAIKEFSPVPVRIKEFSEERQSVVLTSMEYLKEYVDKEESKLLEGINIGDKVTGKVTKLVEFGAFVRIGMIDALLHLSKIPVPVKKGQEIKATIIHIDRNAHQVSLSMEKTTAEVKLPKCLYKEKKVEVNIKTMGARKLRDYLLAHGSSTEEEFAIMGTTLKKRNDWDTRFMLQGNADWFSAYKELA